MSTSLAALKAALPIVAPASRPIVETRTDAPEIDLELLSPTLGKLIVEGVEPGEDRSEKFQHVVWRLQEHGYGIDQIEALLTQHPGGVATKYEGRLRKEIERSFGKMPVRILAADEFSVVDIVTLPNTEQVKPRFIVKRCGDIRPNLNAVWAIKSVLPRGGLGALIAQPNEGKTFVAEDMAMSIARAFPWMGCKTEGGAVLYVSADGPMGNRVTAYLKHHGLDGASIPFAVIEDGPDLHGNRDAKAIIGAAHELAKQTGQAVGLIVFDTLARVLAGGDENSGQDMGALLANVGKIQRETGAAVLLVHHLGKDDKRGARGHSSLLGAVDTAMEIKDGVLTVTKQRDGERGARYGFRIHPVEIGTDADGQPVTSCVVLPDGGAAAEEFAPLTGGATDALEVLEDLVDSAGGAEVTVDQWRTEFIRLKYHGQKTSTSRKAFTRAVRDLKNCDRITERGHHVSTV